MQDLTKLSNTELLAQVKILTTRSREIETQMIALLAELCRRDIHLRAGYSSVKSYLMGEYQMSEDQAAKRSQVVNLVGHHPKFFDLLLTQKTHISHLAMSATKITKENEGQFIEFLPGKSRQDLLFFLARINPDGSFKPEIEAKIELIILCSKATSEKFDRARKLLAKDWRGLSHEEVLDAALEALLGKIDPMRKAERAQKRAERTAEKKQEVVPTAGPVEVQQECPEASLPPRVLGAGRHIPNAIRHSVYLRDGGRCTFISETGKRCDESVSLALDHVCLFSRGGAHELENLKLTCISHNNFLATETLGRNFMTQYLARLQTMSTTVLAT